MRVEKIDITPHSSLLPKLGQSNYSVGEALAELVDNSIDASDRGNTLKVEIKLDKQDDFVSIADNASGMNKLTASKSFVLGESKKLEQLGQFGLGMKTACSSLGKRMTLETTCKGSTEKYVIEFDEEAFVSRGKWQDFSLLIHDDANSTSHGTKITIRNLKFRFHTQIVSYVRKQLSERFAPFIINNELLIWVNGRQLQPEVPEILSESKKALAIELSDGSQIKGWAALLKIGSQEKSGFNMYRRGRLIRAYEKLGYSYHPSKMWITGELNLDTVPVTHNKREFIAEDPLYVEFLEKFQLLIKPLLAEAQKKHRDTKFRDLSEESKETLKDNILKALDKVEDLKELAGDIGADTFKRADGDQGLLSNQEFREGPENKITEIVEFQEPANKRGRKPKKVKARKVRYITIAGEKYNFDWRWDELSEDLPKFSDIDDKKRVIVITLNSLYPLLNTTKDLTLYTSIFVTEGIAEAFLSKNSKNTLKATGLRDKIVTELSRIISEDVVTSAGSKDEKLMEFRTVFLSEGEDIFTDTLSQSEVRALKLRLGLDGLGKDRTLQEVGDIMGVTRERARQLIERGISKA